MFLFNVTSEICMDDTRFQAFLQGLSTPADVSTHRKDTALRLKLLAQWYDIDPDSKKHSCILADIVGPTAQYQKMVVCLKLTALAQSGELGLKWVDAYLEQREQLLQEYKGKTIVWAGRVVEVYSNGELESDPWSHLLSPVLGDVYPFTIEVGNEETEVHDGQL